MSYYDLPARFRPIDVWPGKLRTWRERKRSQFRADWRSTLALLKRELGYLGARDIVIQAALRERDIRQDGYPRADARRPDHPGIILAFSSKHGPLKYAVDTYDDWQDNLRAIALALEALRAVDRYGVTKRGEQYTGWKAIEAPTNGTMTVEDAARFIAEQAHYPDDWRYVLRNTAGARRDAYQDAARRLHPDAGGNHELFVRLQEAKRLLDTSVRQ